MVLRNLILWNKKEEILLQQKRNSETDDNEIPGDVRDIAAGYNITLVHYRRATFSLCVR